MVRLAVVAAVAAVIAIALALAIDLRDDPVVPAAEIAEAIAAPAPAPHPRAVPAPTAAPALPGSLQGTRVDGELTVDRAGRFVASEDARRMFDYFLLAEGEEPQATIRDRVVAEARRRLPADQVDAAVALFDRYVAYRVAGAALLERRPADPIAALFALQRDTFGADAAERMFATDNQALLEAAAIPSRR